MIVLMWLTRCLNALLNKAFKHNRCLDRKLSDSECRPNSPWKRTGAGRVFMENLQGLPIARRVIREQEVPPSSDVDGQGAAGIKPCRCRPILGQGRTKIFTVGIRHSLPSILGFFAFSTKNLVKLFFNYLR
jgi:hypothetical protein